MNLGREKLNLFPWGDPTQSHTFNKVNIKCRGGCYTLSPMVGYSTSRKGTFRTGTPHKLSEFQPLPCRIWRSVRSRAEFQINLLNQRVQVKHSSLYSFKRRSIRQVQMIQSSDQQLSNAALQISGVLLPIWWTCFVHTCQGFKYWCM